MSEIPCPFCDTTVPAADACPQCKKPLVLCGHYRPTALLGRGGMSTVYAATDTNDAGAPVVAIKMLSLGAPAADWKTRELFERSTRTLQDLSHPALPKVHGFQQDDTGRYFLVRDTFDGGTLRERIARDHRHLDEAGLRRLLVALLDLLDYLHRRLPPVVHRDIKPANIMFRTERDWDPVLVDFDSIAAPAEGRSGMTIVGTPGYAAPEQFVGDSSPSSDLYGLGATMLFVLTHVDADALPREEGRFAVEDRLATLDSTLAAVLRKLVEPEKSKRYARASEVLADLEGKSVATVAPIDPEPPNPQVPGTVRPSGGRFTLVVGGCLVAGVAAFVATRSTSDETLQVATATPIVITPVVPTTVPPATPTPPPTPVTTTAPPTPKWSDYACGGIEDCYKKTESWGSMTGKVTAVIGADGRVRAGTYEGSSPWPARKCLTALAKSNALPGYAGPGGKLVCTYTGSILDGTAELMTSGGFKENGGK